MTRVPRCTWLIVIPLLGGCTAEFIVGASGESTSGVDSSGASSNGADESDASGVTRASGDTSSSGDDATSGEVTSGSSGAIETGGETGGETGPHEEAGTPTSEGDEAGEPTGEPVGTPCAEMFDVEGCEQEWHCDWFDSGICWHDPCVEGVEATCDGLGFVDCAATPVCIWTGEAKDGECTYPDCESLEMAACVEVTACAWLEEQCVAAECEPCSEFGMEQCQSNEQCQWVESEAMCSAS